MAESILYKEEIASAISRLVDGEKIVKWDEFICNMKEFIISKYDGKPLLTYKGDWKRRFKASLKLLGYKFGDSVDDSWDESINSVLKIARSAKSKKSSSGTSSGNVVTEEEKQKLLNILNRNGDKWVLTTKKVVEDVFKEVIDNAVYEHPAHSFILDLNDPLWSKYFTEAEIDELKSYNVKPFKTISESLQDYLDSSETYKTADEIREYAFSHYVSKEEFDKKWVQQSVISAIDLFMYEDDLNLGDFSEAELLHRVWSFVYTLFDDKAIRAKLSEKSSVSVSLAKNDGRNLELEEKRLRKAFGAKLDILFKHGYNELGSCEVGRDQVTEVDDKYLDDGRVKLPKTLRDMFSSLVKKNQSQISSYVTVGYLMMGVSLELVMVDVPVGSIICRVSRTEKYEFPQSVACFALDLIPLLEVVWVGKELMKETIKLLNKRKRKAVAMVQDVSGNTVFPHSFYSTNSATISEVSSSKKTDALQEQ